MPASASSWTGLSSTGTACNRTSADFLVRSPLFSEAYEAKAYDAEAYLNRPID